MNVSILLHIHNKFLYLLLWAVLQESELLKFNVEILFVNRLLRINGSANS